MSDNFIRKLGYAIGIIMATCVALCVCGVVVAATFKFLTWLF